MSFMARPFFVVDHDHYLPASPPNKKQAEVPACFMVSQPIQNIILSAPY
jgi:hypothetical protein